MAFKIGFTAEHNTNETVRNKSERGKVQVTPKKSLVDVYFECRGTSYTYYNDAFDLKVGDMVYVEGKLEGERGRVESVKYSFKIKVSDYKRVIYLVDTSAVGEFLLAGNSVITTDPCALAFDKVLTWFKAPENDNGTEYVEGDGNSSFFLNELTHLSKNPNIYLHANDIVMNDRVAYVELNGGTGRALVIGGSVYTVEFKYRDGEVKNLVCSCYCSDYCKHEIAVMMQLMYTLDYVKENYPQVDVNGYLAVMNKKAFDAIAMNTIKTGKIILE